MKIGILASTNQEFIRERRTAGVFEKSGGNRKVFPKMVSKHLRDFEDVMSVCQLLVHQSGPSHRFHKVTSRSLSVFKYMYTKRRAKLRVVRLHHAGWPCRCFNWLGGGFKYFSFSPRNLGNWIIWWAYFSNGLVQPPISWLWIQHKTPHKNSCHLQWVIVGPEWDLRGELEVDCFLCWFLLTYQNGRSSSLCTHYELSTVDEENPVNWSS